MDEWIMKKAQIVIKKNGTYVLDCKTKWGKGLPSVCSLGVSAGAAKESDTQSLHQ